MKTTIYFSVETKVRELDGRLLLSTFLVNDNFNVLIGSRSAIKRELLASNNGIYIPKSVTKDEIEFYKSIKSRGHKIILLHAEGTALFENIEEELKSMFSAECSAFLDKIFVSGSEIKLNMKKFLPFIDNDKVFVVGDPRFDLLKPKYRNYWKNDIDLIHKTYSNFILINTNFDVGNSKVGNQNLIKFFKTNPDHTEFMKNFYLKKINVIRGVMESYIKAIDILSLRFENTNFIIRPHPSESDVPYKKAFKDRKNVRVIYEGNAVKWILASKGVIHYDCTTGIESVLADKNTISYCPKSDNQEITWLPVMVSQKVTEIDDLIKKTNNIVSNQPNKNLSKPVANTLEKYLFNYSSESSMLIAKEIHNLELSKEIYKQGIKELFDLKIKRFRSFLKLALLKKEIISDNNISVKKFSFLTNKEVSTNLQKLCSKNKNLKVKIIGGNLASIKL